MWLLFVTAFFIMAFFIAVKADESMCDTIPIICSVTLLFMYLLAMFRGLKLIYPVSLILIIVLGIKLYKNRNEIDIPQKLFQPTIITFVFWTVVITILTKNQVFTWWDDINYWASDAKQIFFLDGFPGKYGNVSPEFGDYPPIPSLFKYLFLQISAGEYHESLQFAGYYTLGAIFMLPLLRPFDSVHRQNKVIIKWADSDDNLRKRAVILQFVATTLIYFIPGIVSGIIFYGTPSDITMGLVYGALLYAIWDREGHSDLFYFGRIGLYTAVLLLTKSVGFEWAIFALAFFFIVNRSGRRTEIIDGIEIKSKAPSIKPFVGAALFAGAFYGSWLLFCFLNRRVAKATGLGIKMATGSYVLPENALEKAKYFFLGMWTMPMHADHNITFDLSVGGMLVVIAIAFFIMVRSDLIKKEERVSFSLFLVLTGIIAYGLIFFAHISLFQAEMQYLDTFAMTNSISRYGAPFVLGAIYLLMGIALNRAAEVREADRFAGIEETSVEEMTFFKKSKVSNVSLDRAVLLTIALFILLTADYKGMYYSLFGYRSKIQENLEYNESMIDEEQELYIAETYNRRNLWGHRVLNIRSHDFNHWIHDTYISKEASPVSTVYETLMPEDNIEIISDKIRRSHAEYLFVEYMNDTDYQLGIWDRRIWNKLVPDGSFEYGRIYKVEDENGAISLTPAE